MADGERQELQALRDEVTKLKSVVYSLSIIGVAMLLFAGIPFVLYIFVFKKDWDVASTQAFGGVAIGGLVQIPVIYWHLFKAGLLSEPNPKGATPGYPDSNDTSPERAP